MFRNCTKAIGFLKKLLGFFWDRNNFSWIPSPFRCLQDSFGHALTLLAGFPYLSVFGHPSCCCFMLFRCIPMSFVMILPCPLRVCRFLQITLNHPKPPLRPRNSLSVFICGSLPGSGCMARWPWMPNMPNMPRCQKHLTEAQGVSKVSTSVSVVVFLLKLNKPGWRLFENRGKQFANAMKHWTKKNADRLRHWKKHWNTVWIGISQDFRFSTEVGLDPAECLLPRSFATTQDANARPSTKARHLCQIFG